MWTQKSIIKSIGAVSTTAVSLLLAPGLNFAFVSTNSIDNEFVNEDLGEVKFIAMGSSEEKNPDCNLINEEDRCTKRQSEGKK